MREEITLTDIELGIKKNFFLFRMAQTSVLLILKRKSFEAFSELKRMLDKFDTTLYEVV